jgi:hypothetical protein
MDMTTPISKQKSVRSQTTVEAIIHYLTHTKPLVLLLHLFYICTICFSLSLAYVITFHWASIFGVYTQAYDLSNFSNNLKTSVEDDTRINEYLTTVLQETGAMRAYLYRYHDGLGAVSGVQFFFESDTNEVISPGTVRLMQREQNIPSSVDYVSNDKFVQDKCSMILDTTDPNSQFYYYYQSRGAESMVRCPLYLNNGNLFGFVGLDFDTVLSEETTTDYSKLLLTVAEQIQPLFNNKSE